MSAGTTYGTDSSLTLGNYGVVAAVFNGASSVLQVGNVSQAAGNAGANNAGGITIGASSAGSVGTNIQVKEVIAFAAAHSADTRLRIIRYLASVGGISV